MDKKIINFCDTAIENHKFHHHKTSILTNNININKIVVSNEVSFCKKSFKYFIGYKDGEKLDLYAYYFQKWVHVKEISMRLDIFFFFDKRRAIVRKTLRNLQKSQQ